MSEPAEVLAHLREVAEKATPGPWKREFVFSADERERTDIEHYWDDGSEWAYNAEPFRVEGPGIVENGEFSALGEADAEHIATFAPPLVLKLLAVVEAAIERDAAQYEHNETTIDIVQALVEPERTHRYWDEVERRRERCDDAEAAYAAALAALTEEG